MHFKGITGANSCQNIRKGGVAFGEILRFAFQMASIVTTLTTNKWHDSGVEEHDLTSPPKLWKCKDLSWEVVISSPENNAVFPLGILEMTSNVPKNTKRGDLNTKRGDHQPDKDSDCMVV